MSETLDRRVRLSTVANFRDLGGLPVDGGTVARGRVFRSASLSRLSDEDLPAFTGLGIDRIYDLRTASERLAEPDRLPPAVRLIDLDVLADDSGAVAAAIGQMRADPAFAHELLGSGKMQTMLLDSYRDFVTLPSAHAGYRDLFLGLADADRGGAALFHCTAGKDRTGWAAASLLLLLGADHETILADYLQTNEDIQVMLAPMLARAAADGIDVEVVKGAVGVQTDYLDAAFDQLEKQFGTVERYFAEGLALDAATIDGLRAGLVAQRSRG